MGRLTIPRNEEAEKALLASIMIKPKSFSNIIDIVDADSFYAEKNSEVFNAVNELYKRGDPIDMVTVTEEVYKDETHKVTAVYINGLYSSQMNSKNAVYYAKIVQDKKRRRIMMEIADELRAQSQEEDTDTTEITSQAVADLTNSLVVSAVNPSLTQGLSDLSERIKLYQDSGRKYLGYETGMEDLDKLIEGIQDGHFGLVSGYTSAGKTAFALNIMASYIKQGRKVVMFSLEMSAAQLMARLISILSGVPIWVVSKGKWDKAQKDKVTEATKLLKDSGGMIYDDASWKNIQMSMLKESADKNTSLFILDYLQLIQTNHKSDYAGLSMVAKALQKNLKKFKIPMVALSQISNEQAKDDNPMFISTKGAGDLAASADWVVRLKNKESDLDVINDLKKNNIPLPIQCYVQKNRHGSTGMINLFFKTYTNKFINESDYDSSKYDKKVMNIIKDNKSLEDEFDM